VWKKSIITGTFLKKGMPEKMRLIFAFRQGFGGTYGINKVAEKASIKQPLAAMGRGAFQPYFCKQDA
jgi:hypothetical protein